MPLNRRAQALNDAVYKAGPSGILDTDLKAQTGVRENNLERMGLKGMIISDGKGRKYHRSFATAELIDQAEKRDANRKASTRESITAARAENRRLKEALDKALSKKGNGVIMTMEQLEKTTLLLSQTDRRNLFLRLGKSLVTKDAFGNITFDALGALAQYIGHDIRMGTVKIDEAAQKERAKRLKASGDTTHPLLEILTRRG